MLAGGSGITPMYQVLTTILSDRSDRTKVSLIFGNIGEQDILIREELDALALKHPDRFKLYYVLNTPPEGWTGARRRRRRRRRCCVPGPPAGGRRRAPGSAPARRASAPSLAARRRPSHRRGPLPPQAASAL
jgi:ferredoxin-NADP reductase